jgi:hypothetical protein
VSHGYHDVVCLWLFVRWPRRPRRSPLACLVVVVFLDMKNALVVVGEKIRKVRTAFLLYARAFSRRARDEGFRCGFGLVCTVLHFILYTDGSDCSDCSFCSSNAGNRFSSLFTRFGVCSSSCPSCCSFRVRSKSCCTLNLERAS